MKGGVLESQERARRMQKPWRAAQEWETDWWGDCTNTLHEEMKQTVYAHRMGLQAVVDGGRYPAYPVEGPILDLGGGPASLLLKTLRLDGGKKKHVVVDPGGFPEWVRLRYKTARIKWVQQPAEQFRAPGPFAEVWIYNVLQHVQEPAAVIRTARAHSTRLRIFEWIETGTNIGHLHNLTRAGLDDLVGGTGTIEHLNESGCVGTAYYGVFG